MDPTSMYQEIILDHYREKHNSGLREPFEAEVHHVNPTCGDEVSLRVTLEEPGEHVADISYEAQGCSISQASASIMSDLLIGQPVSTAVVRYAEFQQLMEGQGRIVPNEDTLEDAIAFAGVAQFPGRVKCAMLAWVAMRDALIRAGAWTNETTEDAAK
ncbi:MAG: SUF system NifU family Fe-S cluster assembly protein [Propionibacteriaceae bacterium]|jgi:nitrogen fixation NifU-like protein|nr:SUF system NifU family Fe-S cluster assembly protein [Propionibacteriaceae bacterium]